MHFTLEMLGFLAKLAVLLWCMDEMVLFAIKFSTRRTQVINIQRIQKLYRPKKISTAHIRSISPSIKTKHASKKIINFRGNAHRSLFGMGVHLKKKMSMNTLILIFLHDLHKQ